jgi:hypothetical protein
MTSSSRSIFFLLGWLGFLLILASLGIWFAVARSQKNLKAYKSDLERRGETFEISALAPPERDTSGGEKLGAAAQGLLTLVKSGSSRPFSPGRRETTPGQAEIVHFGISNKTKTSSTNWTITDGRMFWPSPPKSMPTPRPTCPGTPSQA